MVRNAVVFSTAVLVVAGCMSARNHPALDTGAAVTATSASNTQVAEPTQEAPYVEAYVEFPGPHDKWAGPASFLLHVSAKESGSAQVYVTPSWFNHPMSRVIPTAGRTPASVLALMKEKPAEGPKPLTVRYEYARERLTMIASLAKNSADEKFEGCMYPVRVRLVRADGGLLEKSGCRSDQGWPFAVSDMAQSVLTTAHYGEGR